VRCVKTVKGRNFLWKGKENEVISALPNPVPARIREKTLFLRLRPFT
jgi:hypothetical protein